VCPAHSQAGMLRSALRLAVRLRTRSGACTGATAGGLGPLLEAFGPERMVARDARSAQPCFLRGVRSAPDIPERWLRSSLLGRYQCEHASQNASSRVGRRRTARRFGRQGTRRRCGSPRPPRAAPCCLQKRVIRPARVAEVRLPCPSALSRASALLSRKC